MGHAARQISYKNKQFLSSYTQDHFLIGMTSIILTVVVFKYVIFLVHNFFQGSKITVTVKKTFTLFVHHDGGSNLVICVLCYAYDSNRQTEVNQNSCACVEGMRASVNAGWWGGGRVRPILQTTLKSSICLICYPDAYRALNVM